MIDDPLVSIIIPAYNAGSYLAESVKSVLAQSYSNWELIIVDDGSTDNTGEIARKLMEIDSRIQCVYQANSKQGKARNKGIQLANGELLAFLDADDWWDKEKLKKQVPVLNNNPDLALVFCNGYTFHEGKDTDYDVIVKDRWQYSDIPLFIESNRIPVLSVLIRKEAIINVGLFTEEESLQNAEDYDLWLKLLYAGFEFRSIDDRLFYYRIHTNQSTYGRRNLTKALFTLYSRFYREYPVQDYSHELVVKIASFLNYATFRREAIAIIKDWVRQNEPGKKTLFPVLDMLPAGWQNKYLKALIGYSNG